MLRVPAARFGWSDDRDTAGEGRVGLPALHDERSAGQPLEDGVSAENHAAIGELGVPLADEHFQGSSWTSCWMRPPA